MAFLPSDVLTHLALATILICPGIPTPKAVMTLLVLVQTCRSIHDALSLESNSPLYATIFELMFDVRAIKRRLGSTAVISSVLASEFQVRVGMLTRIKAASSMTYWDRAENRDDWSLNGNSYLCKVLSMMTENYEKNYYQLACCSVSQLTDLLVSRILHTAQNLSLASQPHCIPLTFSVMWMLTSQGRLLDKGTSQSSRGNLRPFGTTCTSCQRGMNAVTKLMRYFIERSSFPLLVLQRVQTSQSSIRVRYFGTDLDIHIPSLSTLARLCSVDRPWTGTGGFEVRATSFSTRFDADWLRAVSVVTSSNLNSPSMHPLSPSINNAYIIGDFDGMFEGAFFITHPIDVDPKVFTSSQPMQCTLREYHSYSYEESIEFDDRDKHNVGETLTRAWFPKDIQFDEGTKSLKVRDGFHGSWVNYAPYAETLKSKCNASIVHDTIVIGETHPSYTIYGEYKFVGRVRATDGTIALIRTPSQSDADDKGTWVFVGQLHGATDFLGDWRVLSPNGEFIPGGKGWFHMSKTQIIDPSVLE
ncbi:hypothetical protein K439DRAFT_1614577 [Ramaria rubella]|nr:hypothetical protein K439DRAFT_1614577 [Ramaria rubella]